MWGTCAGMILLSDHALMMKQGGQALVGGLNVEVGGACLAAISVAFSCFATCVVRDPICALRAEALAPIANAPVTLGVAGSNVERRASH